MWIFCKPHKPPTWPCANPSKIAPNRVQMIHSQWFHPGDNGCCQYLSPYNHGDCVQRLTGHCQPWTHNRPRCWIVRIRIQLDHLVNTQCMMSLQRFYCYIQLTLDPTPLDHALLLLGSSWLTLCSSQKLWLFSPWPRCSYPNFRLTTHSNDHIISTCRRKDC